MCMTVYNCVCICILKVAEAWERGKSLVHTVLVIILPPLYLHTESKTTKEQMVKALERRYSLPWYLVTVQWLSQSSSV